MPIICTWCKDPELLFKLASIAACDVRPPKTPATYLFGNSQGFKHPIIRAGAGVYLEGETESVWVAKVASGTIFNDYTDFGDWRDTLVAEGVPADLIHPLNMPPSEEVGKPPLAHTGTEAKMLVLMAKQRGWKEVTLVAFSTHILRAFTMTVGQILRHQLPIRIYARGGYPVSSEGWLGRTKLNRGIGEGSFLDSFNAEWKRLNLRYVNEYDLVPATKVMEYLEWRDGDKNLPLPSSD